MGDLGRYRFVGLLLALLAAAPGFTQAPAPAPAQTRTNGRLRALVYQSLVP